MGPISASDDQIRCEDVIDIAGGEDLVGLGRGSVCFMKLMSAYASKNVVLTRKNAPLRTPTNTEFDAFSRVGAVLVVAIAWAPPARARIHRRKHDPEHL